MNKKLKSVDYRIFEIGMIFYVMTPEVKSKSQSCLTL